MSPRPEQADRVVAATRAAEGVIAAVDDLADRLRTVDGLRERAADATRKAANARTRLWRAFWRWRARKLSEHADRLGGRS